MNPRRTLQENESALRKVLTQRTLEALSKQNVAFVPMSATKQSCSTTAPL